MVEQVLKSSKSLSWLKSVRFQRNLYSYMCLSSVIIWTAVRSGCGRSLLKVQLGIKCYFGQCLMIDAHHRVAGNWIYAYLKFYISSNEFITGTSILEFTNRIFINEFYQSPVRHWFHIYQNKIWHVKTNFDLFQEQNFGYDLLKKLFRHYFSWWMHPKYELHVNCMFLESLEPI